MKRKISISTLLGNWKNYGKLRCELYQLWLVLLIKSIKDYKRDWRTWRWGHVWRPSKIQHYWERPEYWEEPWKLEEICCHSNSSEKPSAKSDAKNLQGVNNNSECRLYGGWDQLINRILSECRKLAQKEHKIRHNSEGVDPRRIVQEIEIWPCEPVAYVRLRISSGKWDAQDSLWFLNTNRSPNPSQTT